MINTAYPKRFNKTTGGIAQLSEAIGKQPELKAIEKVILKSLQGKYTTAKQMRTDLIELMTGQRGSSDPPPKPLGTDRTLQKQGSNPQANVSSHYTRQQYRRKKKKSGWKETLFLSGNHVTFYIAYVGLFN